jgi:hypothetical protein
MEKTTDQIKTEVLNYLNKTSNHLFINEKGKTQRIIVEGNFLIIIQKSETETKTNVYNIDDYIKWNGVNTKNVLKTSVIFYQYYNGKMKSIKYNKEMKEDTNRIKSLISGKLTKDEIVSSLTPKEEKKSYFSSFFGK